jgi:hypothetical protein
MTAVDTTWGLLEKELIRVPKIIKLTRRNFAFNKIAGKLTETNLVHTLLFEDKNPLIQGDF